MTVFIWFFHALIIIVSLGLPLAMLVASAGAQPCAIICRERRPRHGTSKKKNHKVAD